MSSSPSLRACLAATAVSLACAAPVLAAPTAITQYGRVKGLVAQHMDEFLGIRYAAPPVGAMRWQPPQPLPEALFNPMATSFGPHCAQLPSAFGIASTTEDCLYLNVYRPSDLKAGEMLPVMLWIHGGALLTGESDDYGPAKLVNPGRVIVVTINYRLGYFGFLAESGLDAEGHLAANYGLQDQQFAMDWVRRNIAGFGGDSSRVTVFGESAGGLSVLSNLASPTAYGLFSRAIVESGGYALSLPTLAAAEATGNAVAGALGCAPADTACLRAASTSQVLATEASAGLSVTTIVDGTTLPLSLDQAFPAGKFNRVPVIDGSNHDEYRLFLPAYAGLTAAEYPVALDSVYGPTFGPVVAQRYQVQRYAKPVYALAAAITDQTFACGGWLIDHWVSRHAPVYAYQFNDRHAPEQFLPPVPGYDYGAAHAIELQFLWDLPELPGTRALSAEERALSGAMVQYWTRFAATGTPNGSGAPAWAIYSKETEAVQSLLPPAPQPESGFGAQHHCGFWRPVLTGK